MYVSQEVPVQHVADDEPGADVGADVSASVPEAVAVLQSCQPVETLEASVVQEICSPAARYTLRMVL